MHLLIPANHSVTGGGNWEDFSFALRLRQTEWRKTYLDIRIDDTFEAPSGELCIPVIRAEIWIDGMLHTQDKSAIWVCELNGWLPYIDNKVRRQLGMEGYGHEHIARTTSIASIYGEEVEALLLRGNPRFTVKYNPNKRRGGQLWQIDSGDIIASLPKDGMTWEEKLETLKAFDRNIDVKMVKPGVWKLDLGKYVQLSSGLGNDERPCFEGHSPQEAVEVAWKGMTKKGKYLKYWLGSTPRWLLWKDHQWVDQHIHRGM